MFWNEFAFYVLKLGGACDKVWEDGSAWCWSFAWTVPW
jgi:hypothetical protein